MYMKHYNYLFGQSLCILAKKFTLYSTFFFTMHLF